MVCVHFLTPPEGAVLGFSLQGHAGCGEAGQDIVCAAVSALTQGTLNGLLNVLKAPVDYHIDEKDGILTASLGEVPEGKRAGAQLLLQTLVSALQMIEADYARFVRVIFKERR